MKKVFLIIITIMFTYEISFAQEIKLEDYHSCWASIFKLETQEKEEISGSISYFSPSQRECRNGPAILAIEKFKERTKSGPVFEIKDTLNISSKCPQNCIYLTRCTDEEKQTKKYLLLIDNNVLSEKTFDRFKKAWTYNTNFELVEQSSKELSCVNEDFGA